MANFHLALNTFAQQIQALNEIDYGDFMREANMDILYLREASQHEGKAVQDKIDEMQLYTQFCPNWVIEPTRSRLLGDVERLKNILDQSKDSLSSS